MGLCYHTSGLSKGFAFYLRFDVAGDTERLEPGRMQSDTSFEDNCSDLCVENEWERAGDEGDL